MHLVSCVSAKRPTASPAKDLYISPLFLKAKAYVERVGGPWFILSTKRGLLHPDEVVAPYDVTLNAMPVAERRNWAKRVLTQLEPHLTGATPVTFLAGHRYREFLEHPLRQRGLAVSVPMEGLKIGEQLSWLTRKA